MTLRAKRMAALSVSIPYRSRITLIATRSASAKWIVVRFMSIVYHNAILVSNLGLRLKPRNKPAYRARERGVLVDLN